MERTKIDEAGHDGAANAPDGYGDDERARAIGEILRAHIVGLGIDRAMFPEVECVITGEVSGRPPRRSVATQSKAFGIHEITARTEVSPVEIIPELQQFKRGIRS